MLISEMSDFKLPPGTVILVPLAEYNKLLAECEELKKEIEFYKEKIAQLEKERYDDLVKQGVYEDVAR